MKSDLLQALEAPAAFGPGAFARWLRHNPEAVAFIDAWLEKRATGATTLSTGDVRRTLIDKRGMPEFSANALWNWLKRNRREIYERGR